MATFFAIVLVTFALIGSIWFWTLALDLGFAVLSRVLDARDRRKARKNRERSTRFVRMLRIARAARNRGEARGIAKEKERMGERAKWLDSVLAGRVAQINAEGRIVGAEAN